MRTRRKRSRKLVSAENDDSSLFVVSFTSSHSTLLPFLCSPYPCVILLEQRRKLSRKRSESATSVVTTSSRIPGGWLSSGRLPLHSRAGNPLEKRPSTPSLSSSSESQLYPSSSSSSSSLPSFCLFNPLDSPHFPSLLASACPLLAAAVVQGHASSLLP